TCSIASRWRSSSTIEARGVDFTDDIVGSIAEDRVDMPVRIRALQASWDTAIAVAAIAAVLARRTVLPREAGIHSDSLNRESSSVVQPPSGPTASDNSAIPGCARNASLR